jgi:hypothetical protein
MCTIMLAPGTWSVDAKSFSVSLGRATIARGRVGRSHGHLLLSHVHLARRGRYEIRLMSGRGRHQKVLLRRFFTVR